ncbi:tetratricopeptide repeat protein [Yinghuangia seranimata]|uniref:tetratricopeptide repeat protein n=1 Tax=Yinghuangia seranimata TaxID=408067 RepID=UPI00248C6E9E|nr:tetratricopeptide repeat protein [Yinghuangia seranimata]MDI2132952.1 tetratricopeptide repeat protein [Yinghuangia seranimata]
MSTHLWLHGGLRRDREEALAARPLPPRLGPVLDAHRRLRGPYTATGTLLRAVVPQALAVRPDLVTRQDMEILSVTPELRGVVPATRETLTSLSVPEERTRYYSRLRTSRMSHGIAEFLRDFAAGLGPHTLVVENAEHADHTDAEFLAIVLRRVDPGVLRVVLCSGTDDLPEGPLRDAAQRHAMPQRVEPSATTTGPQGDPLTLAEAYVHGDCTSDEPALVDAYTAFAPDGRARLHDARADELEARGELTLRFGAVPYHREHGTDPAGAGAAALQFAVDNCSLLGFYHATIELADRARALIGWDQPERRYFMVTSRLTTAYAVLERPQEAEKLYEEACRYSTHPVIHMGAAYATGMLYTRHYDPAKIDHDKARALVNQAVAFASQFQDPKERLFQGVFMNNGLALVEVHQGDLRKALALLDEGIATLDAALAPGEHRLHRSVLHHNRAQVYSGLDQLDDAVAEYTAVIDLDPNYPEYYFDRGNVLRRLGRDDEAYDDYETAIRLSPPFHEAYYNRGDIRAERGDLEGALADFDYVLDLDPEFVDAYVNRAGLRLAAGDLDGAWADTAAGLAVEPRNAFLHTVAGQIHAAHGRPATARACFDQALDEDPEHVAALAGRAGAAYDGGDLAAALADLSRAVELVPDSAELRYNRAMVHRSAGRPAEAAADLAAAADLDPEDPDITAALAEYGPATAATA